jgi:class 3 adenylate cyclase/tetratricopeptide (TPR) repeat protein
MGRLGRAEGGDEGGADRGAAAQMAPERERKQVTVLFADIKDSLELVAGGRDPEEALQVLDPVLELMMDAVHRHGGVVNQVMGDGVMAIFGAPESYEDHALRACSAALALQAAIRRHNETAGRPQAPRVRARIGLHSGEVVVRTIGNDLRTDYSAVGETTHLAARMEQLAAPGTILLMAETYRLVEGYVDVRPRGPTAVKGLPRPVEVFELLGVSAARTRWEARAAHGLTPFVGRERELATLERASAWAKAAHGQLLAVVGDPGVGKSRLVWEFVRGAREQGWLVLMTAAVSHGRTAVFRPLADLFRTYFETDERSDPAATRTAVAQRLQRVDPALAATLPAFLDLMRVPFEDAAWQETEPAQRREQTLQGILSVLLHEARTRPVLLVFEDLQWIDSPTQEALDRLLEVLPGAPMLMLVTHRPEHRHAWAARDGYAEILLEPLAREVAERMLEELLGGDARLSALKQRLIERTEGNPFFLEECVRTLVASNVLTEEGGAYRPAMQLADVDVPVTVHAVLAARIDRLAPADKQLLQTAAVIGRHVPIWLLQAVSDLPDEALRHNLARLQGTAFLVKGTAFGEPEVVVSHALAQDVAYRGVLLERRRAVHRRIVAAIEARYGERRFEHAELLGHHAFNGQQWDKAVVYLRKAGARAMYRSEYAEAAAFHKESLAAASHLPEGRDRTELEIDIRFELRNVLWAVGRLVEGLDYLSQAEPLAVSLGDPRRLARLSAHQTSNYLVLGDNAQALECAREAFARARTLGDLALLVDTELFLGVLHTSLGDYRQALEHLDSVIAALGGDHRHGHFGDFYAVHGYTWRVWCLAELGRFAEAAAGVAQAMRIADVSRHSHNIVAACWAAGLLDRMRGETESAVQLLERAHALCQSAGVNLWLRPSAAMLGDVYVRAGRVPAGIRMLEQAVRPAENNVALAAWKVALAEAYASVGRIDEGEEAAASALTLARERREAGFAAYALRAIGWIAALRGRAEEAAGLYRDALALASERGMLPLAARCHLGLAGLVGQEGEHAAAARDLCRRMGIDAAVVGPIEVAAAS